MARYISILRGINVGGKNKIQMNGLKSLYENLKFTNVVTYIQSGNIIFETDSNPATKYFSKLIEEAIYEHYKFSVPVIIRSLEEMKNVILTNPFIAERAINIEKLHVTFLSEVPESYLVSNIKSLIFLPDRFKIIEREVYLYCPNGYGTTKLNNSFFESKLKITASTRNWNTINKLVELAGNQN
jgi:uncharacterized protein (DUF1697 family)